MTGSLRSLPVLPLSDGFSRRITYLRVSLTDRCNYRCTYCMPEQVDMVPRGELLSFEEIERLVTVFAGLGVVRVRLTGGEPTIRRGVEDLVARLGAVPGIQQIVMTTNGHLLPDLAAPLAAAGLAQLNVSIDSLDPGKFREITRRGDLERVLAGIDAARAAGIAPIKLNVVALAGFNEGELGALCDYAWARGMVPRFIEHMPMSSGELFVPGRLLKAAEIRAKVAAHLGVGLVPDTPDGTSTGPARYWRVDGDPAESPARRRFGIISAMSEHFCDTCNRVRLTATGQLHTCLAYDDAVDLRALVRAGASDAAIDSAIRTAVGVKRHGHEFTEKGAGAPRKAMVSIGG